MYKCILLDIEGTTTSIKFVKDVLFPYIRTNIRNHLEENWSSCELQDDVESLRQQAKEDMVQGLGDAPQIENADADKALVIDSVLANVGWQMDRDRKITALKQLQGHMWRDGYQKNVLQGHVYDDVVDALKLWTSSGKKVYIYSSGSVQAQKLLFRHSIYGNLLEYFSGHFDTKVGLKGHSSSYAGIAAATGIHPQGILFLTDIPAEAVAASDAGFTAHLMSRPGNAALTEEMQRRFSVFTSFAQISIE